MKTNSYYWFMAGTMLGAMGAYMGTRMMASKPLPKRVRSKAANLAGKMSKEAGAMIGTIGCTLADRMR